jgi:hypothetical protein
MVDKSAALTDEVLAAQMAVKKVGMMAEEKASLTVDKMAVTTDDMLA